MTNLMNQSSKATPQCAIKFAEAAQLYNMALSLAPKRKKLKNYDEVKKTEIQDGGASRA